MRAFRSWEMNSGLVSGCWSREKSRMGTLEKLPGALAIVSSCKVGGYLEVRKKWFLLIQLPSILLNERSLVQSLRHRDESPWSCGHDVSFDEGPGIGIRVF
jgi:hypothetical protein